MAHAAQSMIATIQITINNKAHTVVNQSNIIIKSLHPIQKRHPGAADPYPLDNHRSSMCPSHSSHVAVSAVLVFWYIDLPS